MNTQQEDLYIQYNEQRLRVTAYSNGTDTYFTAHLPECDLELKIAYIDENPEWVESNGAVTERSAEIGRLIEEYDGR